MEKPILTDEILASIREITHNKAEGDNHKKALTFYELKDMLGFGDLKTRRILQELKKEGKLEVVNIWRENILGIVTKIPGYILVDKDTKISTD